MQKNLNDNKFYKLNYLAFVLVFGVLSLFIFQDFIFGIISGALLALSIWPIFEWIVQKDSSFLKHSISDSAIFLTFVTTIIVIIPVFYGSFELYNLYSLSDSYISTTSLPTPPDIIYKMPYSSKIISIWNTYVANSSSLVDLLNKATNGKLLTIFTYIWSNLVEKTITIIVSIVTFYLMLKNGEKIKAHYESFFSYWIGPKSLRHIDCAVGAFRATMNGVIFVGLLEGILLSIPMIIGGFTSGFLIAMIAGLLGVIPLLLPVIILPCLAYMYYTGAELWSIIGLIDLVLVWVIFENIVKPQVIGKTVKINTFFILLSMIGGMQLIGFIGLLIGPSVVSVTFAMFKDLLSYPSDQK